MEKETKKPKNPPAFAKNATVNNTPNVIDNGQEGMSLRDYFAAKAMQAILSNSAWKEEYMVNDFGINGQRVSGIAYETADAMLKERDEKRNS